MSKTNAARFLDSKKIAYELVSYTVDLEDLSAIHVANQLGQNVQQVFKTLVLRGDKSGIFIAIIPGDEELNLKLAAKVSGNKSATMIAVKEILGITGYIRGGCSPLGMKKQYPSYIHASCIDFSHIYISAGIRGTQIKINPHNLIQVAHLTVAELL